MEKMKAKVQAVVRGDIYEVVGDALYHKELATEVVSDGLLVHLPDGYFAKVKVSICDATKFDLETERAIYAEKVAAAIAREAKKNAPKAPKKAK